MAQALFINLHILRQMQGYFYEGVSLSLTASSVCDTQTITACFRTKLKAIVKEIQVTVYFDSPL